MSAYDPNETTPDFPALLKGIQQGFLRLEVQ